MRTTHSLSFRTIALIAVFSLTSCKPEIKEPTSSVSQNKHAQISEAITQAADYLEQTVQEDGMFKYRINTDARIPLEPRYNILRHAGTIYALTMYQNFNDSSGLTNELNLTGNYLKNSAIEPVGDHSNVFAVWSYPEVNRLNSPKQAKLGGTGLGLVALSQLKAIQDDYISIEELQNLGRFIIGMQKEDGSFYSKYIPSQGGRNDQWVSLYYPGEAALGLIMLCELDRKTVWLQSSARALVYLAMTRKGKENVPADHWALLATARLFKLLDDAKIDVPRELLEAHALQVCKVMLSQQVMSTDEPAYLGGFSPDGRTTPSATRLEGLIATLEWLPKNHSDYPAIRAGVDAGIDFLLRAQIKDGPYAGGFPRAVKHLPALTEEELHFNRRVTEIRIDYVQHALSALIQYSELK